MGEKDRSSHTSILPHTHTEKDDYFLGMALFSYTLYLYTQTLLDNVTGITL